MTPSPLTRLLFTALATLLLGAGCGTTQTGNLLTDGTRTESRLRSGDLISVRLDTGGSGPQAAQPPSDVVIDENGEISLPLIGRVRAAGSTPSELSERIQASY